MLSFRNEGETKAEEAYQSRLLRRKTERSALGLKERKLCGNMKKREKNKERKKENTQHTGKDKYKVKFRIF